MISFMISVVPPKLDWTRRLSRQCPQLRRAADWLLGGARSGAGWAAGHAVAGAAAPIAVQVINVSIHGSGAAEAGWPVRHAVT